MSSKPKTTKPKPQKKPGKKGYARAKKNIADNKKRVQQISAPVVANQNLKRNVTVRAEFDSSALNLAFASLYSYYASRGLMTLSDDDGNYPESIVNGLNYLFVALCSASKSGTLEVSKAPEVAIDMFRALSSKDISFMTYSKLTFSWNQSPSWDGYNAINVQGNVWFPVIVNADNGSYDSPAAFPTYSPSTDNYSYFLSKVGGLAGTPKASLVDPSVYRSPLFRDVSAFARSYVYNGLQPSQAGGYYKDIENEVGITAPMLSSFCLYSSDSRDIRVPTKLHAYAGDAAFAFGAPLHPTFVSYFNKRSPSFKCIDFEWICGYFTQLLTLAIPKAIALGNYPLGDAVQMTFQDFRIMLRQALLNVFDTQYMTQFTGPLAFGNGDNGFVPFQVNGHCYGSQVFSTMAVPTLIRENLNALKARSIRIKRPEGSKINVLTYFPVLGRYVTDVPAEPQYVFDGVSYPLFSNVSQSNINLVDGTISANNYVNLNCTHYQTCLAVWNATIGQLKAVLQPTTSIAGDQGPLGLGTLFYTAVVSAGGNPTVQIKAPAKLLKSPYLANIKNVYPTEDEKKNKSVDRTDSKKLLDKVDSKKNVKALPPASIISETQLFTTSGVPPPTEMQALLDSLIVPVVRLDPNGNDDQLTLQMYQIETKECLSSKYESNPNFAGGAVWSRISKLAEYCITGVGHDSAGEYAAIVDQLSKHNDAGMLSGLLGGLAKSFLPPDAHGVVDTVADLLPF
jgi:hypothetical protein